MDADVGASGTRRRLSGVPAAVALMVGLIAVPAVPVGLAAALPDRPEPAAAPRAAVTVATESGAEISAEPPAGWDVRSLPNRVVWRSGEALVTIEARDRGGREVPAVADRLMRVDRIAGFSPAYDGGRAASGDGRLAGDTCVVTTKDAFGTCVVLADDDVVVLVQTLGTADRPALPLAAVLAEVTRIDG